MVAKVLYSVTMSLDGYIAGPGGDMQWLAPYLEAPNPEAEALVERVGALLVGRRTYDGDDPNRGTPQEGAFGGRWHGAQFVLTRTPPTDAPDGVVFLDEVSDAVARAKEVAGDRYVNVLGLPLSRRHCSVGTRGLDTSHSTTCPSEPEAVARTAPAGLQARRVTPVSWPVGKTE